MFVKNGQAQPIKIASEMCAICGVNKAEMLHEGQMICLSCKEKMNQTEQVKQV